MTPEAIFSVWCEKSFKKKPELRARFSDPAAKAGFLAQPEEVELAKLADCHVIAALIAHINLKLALAEATRPKQASRTGRHLPSPIAMVSEMFLRRVHRYGLERLTLHCLRHTWATIALERGIRPRVVQERFGHSMISITLGIYSHVGPTLHDEAAETIAGLIL